MKSDADRRAEIESVRNWIREAAERPLEDFHRRLSQRRDALAAVMAEVNPRQANFSPGEGEWSVEQVGRHVARFLVEGSKLSRVLAAGQPPPQEKREMGQLDVRPQTYEEVLAAVARGFRELEAAIHALEGPHDTGGTYRHPLFGELNCREWVAFCFVHVSAHVRQIRRIQSSANYPA